MERGIRMRACSVSQSHHGKIIPLGTNKCPQRKKRAKRKQEKKRRMEFSEERLFFARLPFFPMSGSDLFFVHKSGYLFDAGGVSFLSCDIGLSAVLSLSSCGLALGQIYAHGSVS